MKFLTSLTITLALAAPLRAQTSPSGLTVAEGLARQELEDAARAFRSGKFAEAQIHSERALLIDPQNKLATYFIARTIHAQYKPGDVTPDNIATAREAIFAYQRVLQRVPKDDEAYKAIAYLYGAIKEDELLRAWILQRAADVSFPNDKRAEAFVVLASKEWDCSFRITEQPVVKVTTVRRNKAYVSYKMPKVRVEFEQARKCANDGLEFANVAISLTPESESAWSYKTNILLEFAKLAEMSGQVHDKREFTRQYDEALKETLKLAKRSPSTPDF